MPVNLRPVLGSEKSPSWRSESHRPRPKPLGFQVPEGLDGFPPRRAAKHGKLDYLRFYIDYYPQQLTRLSHKRFKSDMYPLSVAAKNGQVEAVRLLTDELPTISRIERSVRFNVESTDRGGRTALMHAIDNDQDAVVYELIKYGGADAWRPLLGVKTGLFKRADFSNALMYAVQAGSVRCVKELLAWHAADRIPFSLRTARDKACALGKDSIAARIREQMRRERRLRPRS